jgi:hypothetical protein
VLEKRLVNTKTDRNNPLPYYLLASPNPAFPQSTPSQRHIYPLFTAFSQKSLGTAKSWANRFLENRSAACRQRAVLMVANSGLMENKDFQPERIPVCSLLV